MVISFSDFKDVSNSERMTYGPGVKQDNFFWNQDPKGLIQKGQFYPYTGAVITLEVIPWMKGVAEIFIANTADGEKVYLHTFCSLNMNYKNLPKNDQRWKELFFTGQDYDGPEFWKKVNWKKIHGLERP